MEEFDLPQRFAGGGTVAMKGGMSDTVPAQISGSGEPALLSPGEYVIPADVVSMLGDGNSDAGAGELADMIARIRQQKTGRTEQSAPIDMSTVMPR